VLLVFTYRKITTKRKESVDVYTFSAEFYRESCPDVLLCYTGFVYNDTEKIEEKIDMSHENENTVQRDDQGLQELHQQLQECINTQKEWQDRFLRLTADFENYKKRIAKDQAMWIDGAQVQVIKKLLPIIDDMDRAFAQSLPTDNAQLQTWLAGFIMIKNAVAQFLKDMGVEEITAVGDFNPELHEAIAQVMSADHASGTIVALLQKGYAFKGSVIRPASVTVAQ
jgi:molecular chaperone GrpE